MNVESVYRGMVKTRVAIRAKRLANCAKLPLELTESANPMLDLHRQVYDIPFF